MHISPDNHIYIGQTCTDVKLRWGKNGSGYKANPYFTNVIQKYGWDNFEHKVVAHGLNGDDANVMEMALIKKYKNDKRYKVLNLTDGGQGHTGYIFPTSSKIMMSKNMKGRVKINNGKSDKMIPRSEVDRYLQNGWRLGTYLTWTEEQRKQISIRLIGIPHSESRKIHNSESQRRFIWVNDGVKNYRILSEDIDKYPHCMRGAIHRSTSKNCKWVHNDSTQLLIPKNQMCEYLNQGWLIGMLNGGNNGANRDKVRVNKCGVRKYIHKSLLTDFEKDGWSVGW
jgi:hypothetical protein